MHFGVLSVFNRKYYINNDDHHDNRDDDNIDDGDNICDK